MRRLLLLLLIFTMCEVCSASDIRIWTVKGDIEPVSNIVLEGEIRTGDFDKFIDAVKSLHGKAKTVILRTPGGNFFEAMKIGRAMRVLKLTSDVPNVYRGGPSATDSDGRDEPTWYNAPLNNANNCTCNSACFFIHIGAIQRFGDYIGIHRPYMEPEMFSKLSEDQARTVYAELQKNAESYMEEMGVPAAIREHVMDTPSDGIYMLPKEDIASHFTGYIPVYDEWQKAKCPPLTAEENQRMFDYKRGIWKPVTETEFDQYMKLLQKQTACAVCMRSVYDQVRLKAYHEYFDPKGK